MTCKRTTAVIIFSLLFLSPFSAIADFESEVIGLVNTHRASVNLHPLSYSDELTVAARLHSQDMGVNDYSATPARMAASSISESTMPDLDNGIEPVLLHRPPAYVELQDLLNRFHKQEKCAKPPR